MMKKQFHLTKEGLEELKAELEQLKAQREPVAERIKAARELGDLKENAEYTAARQDQEQIETRIAEIDNILQNADIITAPKQDNKIRLGSQVKLKSDDGTKDFQVVGTIEADPLNGKISDESPIGKALLGKKVGDTVEIKTSSEVKPYTIKQVA